MPTVTLSLRSQRSKPVPDFVQFMEVRERISEPVLRRDTDLKASEIAMDLVPNQYTIDVEIGGFKAARAKLDVGAKAIARTFPIENLVSTLPGVTELEPEQRRLLQTLDSTKTPGEIWSALTDNKAATLFQVTYALTQVTLANGASLSSTVDEIVRVGGAEL